MFFPEQPIFIGVTIASMFAGLALLAVAVIMEMWENHLTKGMLKSELEKGTPNLRREVHSRQSSKRTAEKARQSVNTPLGSAYPCLRRPLPPVVFGV